MPKTHIGPVDTSSLAKKIAASVFLSEDRKQRLSAILPRLTLPQAQELSELLTSEADGLTHVAKMVVDAAVESNTPSVLMGIERFCESTGKVTRKAEEGIERDSEGQTLDRFFDDQAV